MFQTPASRSLHKQAGCPGGAPLTTNSSRPLRIAALRACACTRKVRTLRTPNLKGPIPSSQAGPAAVAAPPSTPAMQLRGGSAALSAARALPSGCHAAHQTKHGLHTQERSSRDGDVLMRLLVQWAAAAVIVPEPVCNHGHYRFHGEPRRPTSTGSFAAEMFGSRLAPVVRLALYFLPTSCF